MSGFAKGGVVIADGGNLAIAGVKPSGVAVQGQVIWSGGAPQWKLLNYATGIKNATVPGSTNITLDTTGANLIVFVISFYTGTLGIADGNNSPNWGVAPWWAVLPSYPGISNVITNSFIYVINPVTSTNHTFNVVGTTNYGACIILAFSGPNDIRFDQNTYATATAPQLQLPLLVPSTADALLIAGISSNILDVGTIDSGFNIAAQIPYVSGAGGIGNIGATAALLLQNTPGAVSPTAALTAPNANYMAGQLASFIPLPWQLLASTYTYNGNPAAVLNLTIDSTDAVLLVAIVTATGGYPSPTDSLGNTWQGATSITGPTSTALQIWYSLNPKTGTNHTISSASMGAASFFVAAFSGPSGMYAMFDQSTTTTGSGASIQMPSLSVAANGLVIPAVCLVTGQIAAIDSGFNIADQNNAIGGYWRGGGYAYRALAAGAAVAPNLTLTASTDIAAGMVSFLPSRWKIVASGVTQYGGSYTITLDTTGATLIVVLIASWRSGGNTVTDSAGNTWTYTTTANNATAYNLIAYCLDPITSPSHVFSFISTSYDTFVVLAFKGPPVVVGDFTVITGNQASTLQLPAISVPNDSVVVTCLNNNVVINSSNTSIDSNFTIAGFGTYGAGAYLISNVASSIVPTWSVPPAWPQVATLFSFIPSP